MKLLDKLTLRHMRAIAAGTGVLVVASTMITACGISGHSDGTVHPHGTAHGTFPYCVYKPDDDGIEISHHATTPCVVGDARSKKDRKKKAKPSATAYVPVRPSSSATGHAFNGSVPTKAPTAKTTTAPKVTKSPAPSLKKLPKPGSTKKS